MKIICYFTLLFTPIMATAQQPWKIAEEVTIHSNILNEDRKLYIHFNPQGQSSGMYPVFFQLDGENHLPLVASLADLWQKIP